ncbi:hypothetical protein L1987_05187 [Smallanthus sonchifolius]|uniref:Uncharacterized protein n=1 Tax=Smallanthus sonchifolius TaxID=185202 RepID=A0ACB9JUN5_9ASTR|nr:hypothetical protein L1987_05187 [Smallanthus sonchifolius]
MAEAAHYSSGGDFATVKRKNDDSTTLPPPSSARWQTEFSAPIISSQSPPVYETEIAKQRAQEIAARLFNNAEPKRPKLENGGEYDSTDYEQKPYSSTQFRRVRRFWHSGAEQFAMQVARLVLLLVKGGETIKNIQASSGGRIQVSYASHLMTIPRLPQPDSLPFIPLVKSEVADFAVAALCHEQLNWLIILSRIHITYMAVEYLELNAFNT